MLVKKFEASSMKEALVLVKKELGPEAVIVSAKDINSRFGLQGEKSVEITAAITEELFHKKQVIERSLDKERVKEFQSSSAKNQKKYIKKALQKPKERKQADISSVRYIEIPEDVNEEPLVESSGVHQEPQKASTSASERINNAVIQARESFSILNEDEPKKTTSNQMIAQNYNMSEIQGLKKEILQLKKIIQKFQKMPQSFHDTYPGAEYGLSYESSFLYKKLTSLGLEKAFVAELINHAKNSLGPIHSKKRTQLEAWTVRRMMELIPVVDSNYENRAKIHCFVGGDGHGKSSTLVKLATHLSLMKRKRIMILSLDMFKVGANEQLQTYARILNVPFRAMTSLGGWSNLLKEHPEIDHFLVDYPGLSLKSSLEREWLEKALPSYSVSHCRHYIQSLMSNEKDVKVLADRYQEIGIDDISFTRLDESSQFGVIVNILKLIQVPLYLFGVGSQIPEDFEYASRERVVDLIFKLSQLRKDVG